MEVTFWIMTVLLYDHLYFSEEVYGSKVCPWVLQKSLYRGDTSNFEFSSWKNKNLKLLQDDKCISLKWDNRDVLPPFYLLILTAVQSNIKLFQIYLGS